MHVGNVGNGSIAWLKDPEFDEEENSYEVKEKDLMPFIERGYETKPTLKHYVIIFKAFKVPIL